MSLIFLNDSYENLLHKIFLMSFEIESFFITLDILVKKAPEFKLYYYN